MTVSPNVAKTDTERRGDDPVEANDVGDDGILHHRAVRDGGILVNLPVRDPRPLLASDRLPIQRRSTHGEDRETRRHVEEEGHEWHNLKQSVNS